MNRFEPDTPRAAFGIAAAALTAITLGALVVAPAMMDSRDDAALILARFNGGAAAPVEVAVVPMRVDVIGSRSDGLARTLDVSTAGMKMTAAGLLSTGNPIGTAEQTTEAVSANLATAMAGNGKPDCKPAS